MKEITDEKGEKKRGRARERSGWREHEGSESEGYSSSSSLRRFSSGTPGNQALQTLFRKGAGAGRIPVGTPGVWYEREAEGVARRLAEMPLPLSGSGEERASARRNFSGGRGEPLPSPFLSFYERELGLSLDHVRLHRDERAASLARSLQARAFTLGSQIVFGKGEYAPHTARGRGLLAHELTHVRQNGGSGNGREVAGRALMIRRQPAEGVCSDVDDVIDRVVVRQEVPQSVTLYWSSGAVETDITSTGKGNCCVDTPDGIGATAEESREGGSNWTPITERSGYRVQSREEDHRGIAYWTEFHSGRSIALHSWPRLNGSPLSHGCVRLRTDFARRIYCGAREGHTWVQVRGFARPRCDSPAVIAEWRGDYRHAQTHLDGEETDPEAIRYNRVVYRFMEQAYGEEGETLDRRIREVDPSSDASVAAAIPRCRNSGAHPTREEHRLYDYGLDEEERERAQRDSLPVATPFPVEILARSGYGEMLTPFTSGLSSAGSFRRARRHVERSALELWDRARTAAQDPTTPVTDDRPLYWARLAHMRALRQWEPGFSMSETQRQELLDLFERRSRGMDTISFRDSDGTLRILITGFDPFFLDPDYPSGDIRHSNPSGAAVLALDGTTLSEGGVSARVEGAIFPVRYEDFNAGVVESVVGPFIQGSDPVDLVMTISQGGSDYELERYAGRNRFIQSNGRIRSSTYGIRDNLRRQAGLYWPEEPPDMRGDTGEAAREFRRSSLPVETIRDTLARSGRSVVVDEHVEEVVDRGGTQQYNYSLSGPTTDPDTESWSLKGSGGGYLSNEISYRTLRLRDTSSSRESRELPVGHLHIPMPGSDPEADRQEIIRVIRAILRSTLPGL